MVHNKLNLKNKRMKIGAKTKRYKNAQTLQNLENYLFLIIKLHLTSTKTLNSKIMNNCL